MGRCHVKDCCNTQFNNKNVAFFSLPTDVKVREKWLAFLGYEKGTPVGYIRVCEDHFKAKCIWKRNPRVLLINGSVPTLAIKETGEFLSSAVEQDHNYIDLIIDEGPRRARINQNVMIQSILEDMLISDDEFQNIKSTHICLFCMIVLHKTTEFNIQSNVTKEGKLLEAFIKTSLLYMNLDEHLESYFVCLNCLDMINVLEGYFTKCKNIQERLVKQYAEHKQSKKNKHDSNSEELLTLNAVEDGRQTIDLAIQCNTKDYTTRETQTYDFSTQMEEDSFFNGLLSNEEENEMTLDENINDPKKKSTSEKHNNAMVPHSSSGYCCDKCGKVILNHKSFKHHESRHRNENRFRCEICNKSFAQLCDLKHHSLIHSGIRPHECETCGKKFRLRFQLDNHSKSVHPSAADSSGYCCETCGKLYVSYFGFKMHRLTHRFANKLRCEICDQSFAQRTGLQRHIRRHQGIRPFECKMCGKKYSTKEIFKAHLNSHSGIRNYQCDTCGKAFITRTNLANHMKTHLTIKPYTCAGCGRGFTHRCNMKRHMQSVHENENI